MRQVRPSSSDPATEFHRDQESSKAVSKSKSTSLTDVLAWRGDGVSVVIVVIPERGSGVRWTPDRRGTAVMVSLQVASFQAADIFMAAVPETLHKKVVR